MVRQRPLYNSNPGDAEATFLSRVLEGVQSWHRNSQTQAFRGQSATEPCCHFASGRRNQQQTGCFHVKIQSFRWPHPTGHLDNSVGPRKDSCCSASLQPELLPWMGIRWKSGTRAFSSKSPEVFWGGSTGEECEIRLVISKHDLGLAEVRPALPGISVVSQQWASELPRGPGDVFAPRGSAQRRTS